MKFRAYKVLTSDNHAPNNPKYHYHPAVNKIAVYKGKKLVMCEEGLHVYKSLKNLSIGNFGSVVWEVEVDENDCVCDKDKCVCRKIKFIRKVKPSEVEDSEWAYYYCHLVKDDPEVRKHITKSVWAYCYCRNVKDDPDVRKHITDSIWAYSYCRDVKDDPEIRKHITESGWAYRYCQYVKMILKSESTLKKW